MKRNKRISALIFEMDSYCTDYIVSDITKYNPNSLILIFSSDRINVEYNPLNLKVKSFKIFKSKYLFPLSILIYFEKFLFLCIKYRPKVCWINNTYIAAIIGILCSLGLFKTELIYISGDWLGNKKETIVQKLGALFFIVFDYLACRLSDKVLNSTVRIREERNKLWDKSISKNEGICPVFINIKSLYNIKRDTVCFLGAVMKHSGVDIIINSLDKIRENGFKEQDIKLKIIGSLSQNEYYSGISGISFKSYIKLIDFTERDKLSYVLSDCFCGVNLITNSNTHSSYTIPSKIISYLQFLLPVIATEGCGYFADVIKDNKLGIIIKPIEEEFTNAVVEIFNNQKEYRENIVKYINSSLSVKNIIKTGG